MQKPESILILGGSGQIGHALCRSLGQKFPQARVVGTTRSGKLPNGQQHIEEELRVFDPFRDPWESLGQYEVVINAIGQIRESREFSFERIHSGLTELLLKHRTKLGQPRLLQLSALGADAGSNLKFLSSKARADALLGSEDDTYVIRPSIVCTPSTMLVQKLKMLANMARVSLGHIPVPRGFPKTRIQPILMDDLQQLIARLCEDGASFRTLEAAGPAAISFRELLELTFQDQSNKLQLMELPRPVIEPSVKYFVAPMLPGILTYEQFQLLFQDNISAKDHFEKVMGRMPGDTIAFWKKELSSS